MAKFPKSLTRVTGFSKFLALLLILGFLFVAFYAGVLFDQQYVRLGQNNLPAPTQAISEQSYCAQDSDCVLTTDNTQNSCCPNTHCLNLSDNSTIAVNEKWLTNEKISACGEKHMCPMIAAICTKDIQEKNSHYSAKCVSHMCTKVQQ